MEKKMPKVLSIWFPQLPLDRLARRGDPRLAGAFAIASRVKRSWSLSHVNEIARENGLAPGLPLSDARAVCPDLAVEPADEAREAALLRSLGHWADFLSPRIALDPPDGLLLDISGCTHLFGGERPMAEHAQIRLESMRITSAAGIADTKGAAWALARFGGRPVNIVEPGRMLEALEELPLAALNLPMRLVADLSRTGIRTIGQLNAIKPAEVASRFGTGLTDSLARVLGGAPDPLRLQSPRTAYAARMTLPDPIGLADDLENALRRLADSVCKRLRDAQCGGRRFRLAVGCIDSKERTLTIGFARPCNSPPAIVEQFSAPLRKLKIEFGADRFRLSAAHVEPVQARQLTLDSEVRCKNDADHIVSTLGNRLGFDRVRRFVAGDSHLPEKEYETVEAMNCRSDLNWQASPRKRPLRLYKLPEPLRILEPGRPPNRFEWRGQGFDTKSAAGPERLNLEWWQGEAATRDYWRVQTRNGPRLWLLTYPARKSGDWFVAGRFP